MADKLKIVRETNAYPDGTAANALLAAQYLKNNVFPAEDSWRESCYLLTLDSTLNIKGVMEISKGGLDNTVIDKRIIVKAAIDTSAAAVILAHNHPNGNPKPSQRDIRETQDVRKALDAFGIKLADHIILTDHSFYSFEGERVQKLPVT